MKFSLLVQIALTIPVPVLLDQSTKTLPVSSNEESSQLNKQEAFSRLVPPSAPVDLPPSPVSRRPSLGTEAEQIDIDSFSKPDTDMFIAPLKLDDLVESPVRTGTRMQSSPLSFSFPLDSPNGESSPRSVVPPAPADLPPSPVSRQPSFGSISDEDTPKVSRLSKSRKEQPVENETIIPSSILPQEANSRTLSFLTNLQDDSNSSISSDTDDFSRSVVFQQPALPETGAPLSPARFSTEHADHTAITPPRSGRNLPPLPVSRKPSLIEDSNHSAPQKPASHLGDLPPSAAFRKPSIIPDRTPIPVSQQPSGPNFASISPFSTKPTSIEEELEMLEPKQHSVVSELTHSSLSLDTSFHSESNPQLTKFEPAAPRPSINSDNDLDSPPIPYFRKPSLSFEDKFKFEQSEHGTSNTSN